jgi:hypothetical protein
MKLSGNVTHAGKSRNKHNILVEQYEGKSFLGKTRRRYEAVNAWTGLTFEGTCASNPTFSNEHSFMELTS